VKITCSTGAMIGLQSFSIKLGDPGDILVARLFKIFSIPLGCIAKWICLIFTDHTVAITKQ